MERASTFVCFEFFEEDAFFFLQVTFHDLGIGLSLSLGVLGSATLTRELHTHTVDTRSHVLDRCEFDLEFGFWRDCMQSKDF